MAFIGGLLIIIGSLAVLISLAGFVKPQLIRKETRKDVLTLFVLAIFTTALGGAIMPTTSPASTFTVREYKIYREVIDSPSSENEVINRIAKNEGVPAEEIKGIVDKVMRILYTNNWFSTPEQEIKHASDAIK